ncbi:hypothetical protein D3C71_1023780 [compost metagenome]
MSCEAQGCIGVSGAAMRHYDRLNASWLHHTFELYWCIAYVIYDGYDRRSVIAPTCIQYDHFCDCAIFDLTDTSFCTLTRKVLWSNIEFLSSSITCVGFWVKNLDLVDACGCQHHIGCGILTITGDCYSWLMCIETSTACDYWTIQRLNVVVLWSNRSLKTGASLNCTINRSITGYEFVILIVGVSLPIHCTLFS